MTRSLKYLQRRALDDEFRQQIHNLALSEIEKQEALKIYLTNLIRDGVRLDLASIIRGLTISNYATKTYKTSYDFSEIFKLTEDYLKGISIHSRPQDFLDFITKKIDRQVKTTGEEKKYYMWGKTLSDNPRQVHLDLVGAVWNSEQSPPSVEGEWPGEWKNCQCQLIEIEQADFYKYALTQFSR